jgi:pimeloyl-ACP methyl ester carboxylesterase
MEIVHSRIVGQGPAMLILHGYLGMGDNWKSLANRYGEFYEVHLIDMRNHGRSFHSDLFDYDVMVEDILNYLEEKDIDKMTLIGHSMGGKAAMNFAVKHGKRLDKLIIADISPRYYPDHHQDILKALNAVDFQKQKSRGEIEQVMSKSIKEPGVIQFLMKNIFRRTKDQLDFRFNLPVLTQKYSSVGVELEIGSSFDGATLFLKGARSNYIGDADVAIIHSHFPNALIQEISGAGHWLHAENPSEFLDKTLNFLQRT